MAEEPVIVAFFDGDELGKQLSNFAYSPFTLDDKQYATVEGFWQSLKFSQDPIMQRKISMMIDGIDAKQEGKFAPSAHIFEYEGRIYNIGGEAHHALLERALRAKFGQNELFALALMKTGARPLKHRYKNKHGVWRSGDSPRLPAIVFERLLEKIRKEIIDGTFHQEMALPEGIDTSYESGIERFTDKEFYLDAED